MLTVVYDTNVVVSAALKPGSTPAALVALAMRKYVQLTLSPAILAEYAEVLKRPKFHLALEAVEAFLQDLERAAVIVHPSQQIARTPDDPDNRFLECAQAAKAAYLVTGNTKHFPFPDFEGARIVSPAEFARILTRSMI